MLQDEEVMWIYNKKHISKADSLQIQNEYIEKYQPCLNLNGTIKNYKCDLCGKKFSSIILLESHDGKCPFNEINQEIIQKNNEREYNKLYRAKREDFICECGTIIYNSSIEKIAIHKQTKKHEDIMNGELEEEKRKE